jgi:hypothetical protein
MKRFSLFLIVILPFSLAGCGPWCEDIFGDICDDDPEPPPYRQVGITLNRMLRDGDQVCTYVSENQNLFNERFRICTERKITQLDKRIDDIILECKRKWPGNTDWQLACEEEKNVSGLSQQFNCLLAMLEVTHGSLGCDSFGCDCQVAGQYYQVLLEDVWNYARTPDLPTWDELMDSSLEWYKKEYTCFF